MIVSLRGYWGLGKFCGHKSRKVGIGVGIRAEVYLEPANEAEKVNRVRSLS